MRSDPQPVPLRFRIPKPPRPFVGREGELGRLATLLGTGNAVIVSGLAGVGKSSLVRAFGHREESFAGRTIFLSISGALEVGAAFATVARAVASANAAASVAISAHADEDLLLESTFEIAERSRYCVIIDNLDLLGDAGETWMLSALRHAEHSQWIGTSKILPRSEDLQKQTLRLEGLGKEPMRELGRAQLGGRPEGEIAALIERAGGSPGELFRMAFGPAHDLQPGATLPWAAASSEAQRVAEVLAAFDGALDASDLDRITGGDATPHVEELVRRGIVSLSPRIDLEPAVRAQLRPAWLETARALTPRAMLDDLFSDASPHTKVLVIRLLLSREDVEGAAQHAATALESLLDAGLAQELCDALAGRIEPRLRELRIVAADSWGADDALRWAATEPRPEGMRARLAWASARAFAGEPEAGLDEARAVLDVAETASEKSAAALLVGRCSRMLNTPRLGIAALETAPAIDDVAEMVRRNALLGVLYALDARGEEAQRAIDLAQTDIALVAEGKRVFVIALIASAYNLLGRLTRCKDVLDTARRTIPRIRTMPWWTRQYALVGLESGELEQALAWAEGVIGSAKRLRRLAAMARMVKLRVHLAEGNQDDCRASVETLFVDTDLTQGEDASWTSSFAAYAAIVLGDADAEGIEVTIEAHDAPARMHWALRAILARRRGRAVPLSDRGIVERHAFDPIDVRIIELRERAEERMIARDFAGAEPYLIEAQRLSHLHGWVLLEADMAALRGELAFLRGQSAAAIAAEIVKLVPTSRYQGEAELLRLVSAPVMDVSAIAALAGKSSSPIAARRAHALAFGDSDSEDLLDRAFIEEARRRHADVSDSPRSTRSIALHEASKEAVLGGGAQRIDFTRHDQLWRLLVVLVAREVCTKEELVEAGWATDYHPLRDDGRLRVTIGRLRKMLNVPGGVTIVSSPTGYRLVDRPG